MADECIPLPVVRALQEVIKATKIKAEVAYLPHWINKHGVLDDEWALKISQDKGWIVVSADSNATRSPRLTHELRARSVSAFYLRGNGPQAKAFEKLRRIVSAWPLIEKMQAATPGTRFSVTLSSSGWVIWEEWPFIKEPPARDGELF